MLKWPESGYLVGCGVHNGLSAALADEAGFDVLWLSSLELATSKCLPDANVLGSSEVAAAVREVRYGSSLPLLIDAETAFASNELAQRMALDFLAAGGNGLCIEDSAFPKRCSYDPTSPRILDPIDRLSGQIKAIKSTVGKQLAVVARTEALIAGCSSKIAIDRGRAYIEAGADALFVQGTRDTRGPLEEVLSELRQETKLITTATALPQMSAQDLYGLGAHIIIFPNGGIRTILSALRSVFKQLRASESLGGIPSMASLEDIFALIDRAASGRSR